MATSRPRAVVDYQLLHDIFDASPIGIVVEDLEGQPFFINPAFCGILGFTEEELRNKHCVHFSPPEDAEQDWALFQQLRAGAIDHYQLEKRYFHRDGSLVWGRLSLSLLRSRPSPLVIAMVEEITDQKKAEESLRNSEERLRLAQQAARIGAFEWNIRTGADTWTPELEAMHGLPPGAFAGTQTAWEKLLHPNDLERVLRSVDEALKTGQPMKGEWRVVWPDGSVHWIAGRWQALMDDFGEPLRMLGVNVDVSERKEAEERLLGLNRTLEAQATALQSREELLRVFVKNVPSAVAMLDRDMHYLQVSDRWCTDYLPGKRQIIGRSHYEIFPEMPERWKEVHRRALQGETLRADEDYWVGQDGPHWARWEVRPWQNADGTTGGILILAEDVTRRKQMEAAISGLSRKLIQSQEQERTRIARDLHDDVSQQLALLAVELDQCDQSARRNPDLHDHLEHAKRRIAEIGRDVQSLSHQLHSSKLEYLGLVAAAKSFCKEVSEMNDVQIDFKEDGVPRTLPNEVSLSLFRILQQAVHNAVEHSGVKHMEVGLWEQSHELHLQVKDLGKGFDLLAEMQGVGLGLTSMRERARLVNGNISIESKPRQGTTIHVRVPLNSAPGIEKRAV